MTMYAIAVLDLCNRIKLFFQKRDSIRPVPLNMAYDAELERLQLEVATLRFRLHRTKQHNKTVTKQLLEQGQQVAVLQTEVGRLKAEVDYWHARTTKLVKEGDDLPQPPSLG